MMDIEKLIHCLQCCARVAANNGGCDDCGLEYCGPECQQLCGTAATALSTLQDENEKLREELEQVKRERDAAVNAIRTWRFCESCNLGGTPMNYDCLGCYRASKWVWNGQKEDDNA